MYFKYATCSVDSLGNAANASAIRPSMTAGYLEPLLYSHCSSALGHTHQPWPPSRPGVSTLHISSRLLRVAGRTGARRPR